MEYEPRFSHERDVQLETLIDALADPDPAVAAGAVQALVRLGDARAVKDLIACLDESEPPLVQFAAIHALAQLGGSGIADRLIEIAGDQTRDPGVRMAAESEVRALGVEPEPRRVGFLPVWLLGMLVIAAVVTALILKGAFGWALVGIGVIVVAATAGGGRKPRPSRSDSAQR